MTRAAKPPLGLMPYRFWKERYPEPSVGQLRLRYFDVTEAIERYRAAGCDVPNSWFGEVLGRTLEPPDVPRTDVVRPANRNLTPAVSWFDAAATPLNDLYCGRAQLPEDCVGTSLVYMSRLTTLVMLRTDQCQFYGLTEASVHHAFNKQAQSLIVIEDWEPAGRVRVIGSRADGTTSGDDVLLMVF